MQAVYDFFIGEWYFAIILVAMSLAGASLVVWRFLLNRSANTDMNEFLPFFQDTLRKKGIKTAIAVCKEEKGLVPNRLFVAGLEAADQGAAAMRRSMSNETEIEIIPQLNFLLAPILAIAKIATMVGLFFTVISMINTFDAIGQETKSGNVKGIGGHSSKIGLALFATPMGLVTALPLGFSHVLFKEWISRFETRMKSAGQKLITLVVNYKRDPKLLDRVEDDEDEDGRKSSKKKAQKYRPT